MGNYCKSLSDIKENDKSIYGPKAFSLGELLRKGYSVPQGFGLSTDAFNDFICHTGLYSYITKEIYRKDINQMRWEEIWDLYLRIKNAVLSEKMPKSVAGEISTKLQHYAEDARFAVRSSAPDEDTESTSFAGLHDSYIGVSGYRNILNSIKLVWASLYSTGSLVYRKKNKNWFEKAAMSVIIQKTIKSIKSGLVFTMNPDMHNMGSIESVWGYNQGLVDGSIEPFRWNANRKTKRVSLVVRPEKVMMMTDPRKNIIMDRANSSPPLTNNAAEKLFIDTLKLEKFKGQPLDIEWTANKNRLYFIQMRPITTIEAASNKAELLKDRELKPDLKNLFQLSHKIMNEILPEMEKDIAYANDLRVEDYTPDKLLETAGILLENYRKWKEVYYSDLIPFAHGFRYFGEVYNSKVKPKDPYEYIKLLSFDKMVSVSRNREIQKLADKSKKDPELYKIVSGKAALKGSKYDKEFDNLISIFQNESAFGVDVSLKKIIHLIKQYRDNGIQLSSNKTEQKRLMDNFLSKYKLAEKSSILKILDLARDSYKLRDDDNIIMGRLEVPLIKVLDILGNKLPELNVKYRKKYLSLKKSHEKVSMSMLKEDGHVSSALYVRQLTGHPASHGAASGKARVIRNNNDLFKIKAGEVMVCDSIDPNMTFVIPAAAAIVERRGGMLVHGAIIAREYGIPCVTGIQDAVKYISTGKTVHVDGDLGIVTIEK
jgi:pyruvate,water dikinase